jgi:7-cyano-7-deazaguanine reductase
METYQGNIISVLQQLEAVMENDLSKLLETEVRVCVKLTKAIDDAMYYPPLFATADYPTLENNIDVTSIKSRGYKEDPSLLGWTEGDSNKVQRFHSALLKSNCRVTSQPDWGDVYIHYKGPYQLNQTSLLQYIVSFRDECHFHEEICETIYKRLYDLVKPEELMVSCLYVRRGGIDINPIRANSQELLKQNHAMWDKFKYFPKTVRQ